MSSKDKTLDEFNGNYQLITDSQEIFHILKNCGIEEYASDITGIVVLVGDGEYTDIWLTESNKPYMNHTTYSHISEW